MPLACKLHCNCCSTTQPSRLWVLRSSGPWVPGPWVLGSLGPWSLGPWVLSPVFIVSLLVYMQHNHMYYGVNRWVYQKEYVAHSKQGVGLFLKVDLFFWRLCNYRCYVPPSHPTLPNWAIVGQGGDLKCQLPL